MSQHPHHEAQPLLMVRDLTLQGASGLVTVQKGRQRYTLCLKNGRLVFATANLKRFQVTAWLDAAGWSATGTHTESTQRHEATGGLVDALVRDGAGTRADIIAEVQRCLRSIVIEALTRNGTECSFRQGTPVTRDEITITETTAALLLAASTAASPEIRLAFQSGIEDTSTTAESAAGAAASSDDPVLRELLELADVAEGKTLYELLDVESSADEAAIRSAYYGMARRCHPDIWRGEKAASYRSTLESLFTAVTEAYNRLRRPHDRAAYDEELQVGKRHADRARQDPAKLAEENYTRGCRALAADNLHDAHQFLANAVRLDPARPEHHRELGIVQMLNPRWQKKAEKSLRRAVELQPTDTRALSHLGSLYKKNGLLRRAEDLFDRALQWDPDNELVHAQRAASDDSGDTDGRIEGLFGRH